MKQTAVEWLIENLITEPFLEEHFEYNYNCWDKAKEMEKKEKLKYQLFIGKVMEIIGDEKTIKLLRECYETFKSE
jgi:hypothetical protein